MTTTAAAAVGEQLRAIGAARFTRSCIAPERFFATGADAVPEACRAMAKRFVRSGRLLAFGEGAAASDASHIAVEFVHPVIVGKRALPALALEGDFAARIALLGAPVDIAMGISADGEDRGVLAGLAVAREHGLLTVGLSGGNGGTMATVPLDHLFIVPEDDPLVVQEVHETLYHVLWELVHVFFDHRGLL